LSEVPLWRRAARRPPRSDSCAGPGTAIRQGRWVAEQTAPLALCCSLRVAGSAEYGHASASRRQPFDCGSQAPSKTLLADMRAKGRALWAGKPRIGDIRRMRGPSGLRKSSGGSSWKTLVDLTLYLTGCYIFSSLFTFSELEGLANPVIRLQNDRKRWSAVFNRHFLVHFEPNVRRKRANSVQKGGSA